MKSKLLIVDDNQSIRSLIKGTLNQEYEILEAESSENALNILNTTVPDMILLDIMLPGLSGLELCSIIRNQEQFAEIPIIGISAKTGSNSRTFAYELGFTNYMEKPFETNELKTIVKSTLKSVSRKEDKILTFGDLSLSHQARIFKIKENVVHITPKEHDIIKILMKNIDKVVTRENILNVIDFDNLDANDRNIDNFISSIRRKIKTSNVQLKTHYSIGYQLELIKSA